MSKRDINSHKMLLSVIILAYNQKDVLKQCIDSVLMQSYDNIEILVGDDSSYDYDEQEIKLHISKNRKENIKRIELVHHLENIGIVQNAAYMLKLAKGNIIKFIGADDILIHENVLRDIVNVFEKNKVCDIVVSKYIQYDQQLKQALQTLPTKEILRVLKRGDRQEILDQLAFENIFGAAGVFLKREALIELGLPRQEYRYLDDWPTWLYMMMNGKYVIYYDYPTVKYRIGGISTGKKGHRLLLDDQRILYREMIVPNINKFSRIRHKEIEFIYKRLNEYNGFSNYKKIVFSIRYSGLIIKRKIRKFKNKLSRGKKIYEETRKIGRSNSSSTSETIF